MQLIKGPWKMNGFCSKPPLIFENYGDSWASYGAGGIGPDFGLILGLVNSWFTARKVGYLMCDNMPLVHVFVSMF